MQIRKDIPSKMYHYTSLESLCSIVENQEFWLGDTRQMNDYNEALELLNILNSLLNEDADLRDDPQCRDVILSINRNTLLKTPIYVACFTKLADDAAQWERYANNAAGVAIEFDVAKFERAMQFNSQMLRCITYKALTIASLCLQPFMLCWYSAMNTALAWIVSHTLGRKRCIGNPLRTFILPPPHCSAGQ